MVKNNKYFYKKPKINKNKHKNLKNNRNVVYGTKKTPKKAVFYDILVGGAGGYCLPVRTITGIPFYAHSFLFHLGLS